MITKFKDRTPIEEIGAEGGEGRLILNSMIKPPHAPEKLRMYSYAELEPDASVGYHVHEGECEFYYILSGSGEYDDNGKICSVSAGDVTYTPSGEGHGIKNTGSVPLSFIALIIAD